MTARTVHVRDDKGREFETLAVDARRYGYTVLGDGDARPKEAPEAPELPETPAEPTTAPNEAPPSTSATPAAGKKKTQAAVIDSESAPTSEGTDR